jgi:hypothetical protein
LKEKVSKVKPPVRPGQGPSQVSTIIKKKKKKRNKETNKETNKLKKKYSEERSCPPKNCSKIHSLFYGIKKVFQETTFLLYQIFLDRKNKKTFFPKFFARHINVLTVLFYLI